MNSSHGLAQLSSPSSWSQESIHIPAWDLIPQLDVFVMVSKPYYPLNMLKYRWLATVYQLKSYQVLSQSFYNPPRAPASKIFFWQKSFSMLLWKLDWQLSDGTDWTYEIPSNPFPSCHDIIFSGSSRNYHLGGKCVQLLDQVNAYNQCGEDTWDRMGRFVWGVSICCAQITGGGQTDSQTGGLGE